jgi:hypothetical protein
MKYYACCTDNRRSAVEASANLNGIDFVEVVDHDATAPADRQRILRVHFLKPVPAGLTRQNVVILGGDRIRGVALDQDPHTTDPQVVELHLNGYGDYSTYTLRFVQAGTQDVPLSGLDPQMWETPFWFKVECPSPFDCQSDCTCTPQIEPAPHIDYLAKDYATFRQLMLDRMSAIMPSWTERRAADFGVATVEVLAYVADRLSYQQDAIATEAYLKTARRRISVRRHARLVDYFMHDGCNARTWVHFDVTADQLIKQGTQIVTRLPGQSITIDPDPDLMSKGQVFELLADQQLRVAHNSFSFYTWGEDNCCLPKGATQATLAGNFPNLVARDANTVGDVLIFMEIAGPETGAAGDADPAKRHAVRLTKVVATDSVGQPLVDPLNNTKITQITWDSADALPFPLCISATPLEGSSSTTPIEISIALGNNIPADHGSGQAPLDLGTVQKGVGRAPEGNRCNPPPATSLPARFSPLIYPVAPITQAASYDSTLPASQALAQSIDVVPQIQLLGTLNSRSDTWIAGRDLLNSNPSDLHFVVEMESDGSAQLRFGDDEHGKRPEVDTSFSGRMRLGNGIAGNIGADTLYHIVGPFPVSKITNPLPASGGLEPETMEQVRRNAPQAFRTQNRAVTEKDYEACALLYPGVQRAAATIRFTGSWFTVYLTVDREGGLGVDQAFHDALLAYMDQFRMAGYDLEIDGPRFVSLDIQMTVCVKPDYFRAYVEQALLELFSSRTLPSGKRGVFHPDNFTFGQPVYLSKLYAAAQSVEGVRRVTFTRFQRLGSLESSALDSGKLPIGRLEIARLDANADFPDRGKFELIPEGGK